MGVKGLWQLIEPTGKPVTLESLEGKVLAVDASIWLNQTVKGMRDRHGNPLPNAHLIGLFHRVCKLLFYKIKPVFVFDGATPALKRQTLAARKQKKDIASQASHKATKKLVESLLKQHALRTVLGGHAASTAPVVPAGVVKREGDMFQLPPEPDRERQDKDVGEESAWELRMEQKNIIYKQFGDLEKIDLESDEFKSLPADVRHEILTELKEERSRNHWSKMHEMPQEADNFSNFQVERLMKKSKLSRKIDHVVKELNAGSTVDIAASLTSGTEYEEAQARRIVSEDAGHYILIKGLTKQGQNEQAVDILSEQEQWNAKGHIPDDRIPLRTESSVTSVEDATPSTSGNSTLPNKQVLSTIDSSDDETIDTEEVPSLLKRTTGNIRRVPQPKKRAKRTIRAENIDSSSSSDSDLSSNNNGNDKESMEKIKINTMVMEGNTKNFQSINNKNDEEEDQLCTTGKKPTPKITELNLKASNIGSVFISKISASQAKPFTVPAGGFTQTKGPSNKQKESSSSESREGEGFIEITIDPTKSRPEDDLFPASIFDTREETKVEDIKKFNDTEQSEEEKPITPEKSVETTESDDAEGDVRMNEEEQRQLQQAIQESLVESGAHLVNESRTEMTERIDEPANVFEGLSREELLEVNSALESENNQLQQQRAQLERIAISITAQMVVESQALLELFGIPYIVSPTEAEAQCAHLDLTNQTAGTITDDSDIWLFGGRTVYKNFFNQSRHVELYRNFEIGQQLLLNRFKMINLALMCGSDYTQGVQGIGPVSALEVLAEFPGEGLEPLKNFKKWWEAAHQQKKVPSETKIKSKLRQVELPAGFPNIAVSEAYLKPVIDDSEEPFSWAKPDILLLTEFAKEKLGWSKEKTDEILQPVIKSMAKTNTQAHITSFFARESIGETKKMKSKRVMQTLTRMRIAEKEKIERVQNVTGSTVTDSGDNVHRSATKSATISPAGIDNDCSVSRSGESNERINVTSRICGSIAPLVIRDKSMRTQRKKGQSNRGKSRGRGRATGSIPSEPVEVIKSTRGKDRRDWHHVVLSESSSSSEFEDEKS